jgi:HSP20 family protein
MQRGRFMDRLAELESEREVLIPVDVKAEADAFVVVAMLPGVKADDLNIQIVNETVSIQGKFNVERNEQDSYLLQERPGGNFCRTLTLPDSLDSTKAEAELKDGILTLRIPKAEEARPKTIKVVAKE